MALDNGTYTAIAMIVAVAIAGGFGLKHLLNVKQQSGGNKSIKIKKRNNNKTQKYMK
jgi:hypothetical protein